MAILCLICLRIKGSSQCNQKRDVINRHTILKTDRHKQDKITEFYLVLGDTWTKIFNKIQCWL